MKYAFIYCDSSELGGLNDVLIHKSSFSDVFLGSLLLWFIFLGNPRPLLTVAEASSCSHEYFLLVEHEFVCLFTRKSGTKLLHGFRFGFVSPFLILRAPTGKSVIDW